MVAFNKGDLFMKNLSILSVFALLALTVVGCSDDNTDAPQPNGVKVSFQAECDAEDTRINIAETKPSWVAGDAIGVYAGENQNVQFTTQEAGAIATFTGEIAATTAKDTPVYAYYPYAAEGMTLPAVQEQLHNQFGRYSVMTAQGKVVSADGTSIVLSGMTFKAHTAALRFHVYGSMREVWGDGVSREKIQNVTIKTAQPVENQVSFKDGVVTFSQGKDQEMTVALTNEQPMCYKREQANGLMLTVPAQTMTITEVVITTNQAVYTKTINKELTLTAGHILPIALNINTFVMKERFWVSVAAKENDWSITEESIRGRKGDFFAGFYDYTGKTQFKYRIGENNWFAGANIDATTIDPKNCYTIVRFWKDDNAYVLINKLELRGGFGGWDAGQGRMFEFQPDQNLWKISGLNLTKDDYLKVFANDGAFAYVTDVDGAALNVQTPLACRRSNDTNGGAQKVAVTGTYDVLLDLTCEDQAVLVLEPVK